MTDPPSPNSVPIPDELVERGARAIMESASGRAVIPPSYPACQRYARAVLEAALPLDDLRERSNRFRALGLAESLRDLSDMADPAAIRKVAAEIVQLLSPEDGGSYPNENAESLSNGLANTRNVGSPEDGASCPRCHGDGEITVNPSKRIPPDPQMAEPARCPECGGTGDVYGSDWRKRVAK